MLSKRIFQWARAVGLILGIAPVQSFERGRAVLDWRYERGLESPFTVGSIEENCRPGLVYPWARSIIVTAKPNPRPENPPGPGEGFIAGYALGPDYHDNLGFLLQELAAILKDAGGSKTAVQVDKGPVLEREAACIAGLGYYGANCNLIVPGVGSQVTMGLVFTDLELEPGEPLSPPTCENCGRCISTCPVSALVAPGYLEPRRCLSYLTQVRGYIPHEMRSHMGRHIFGCDLCQEVCPANRREGRNPDIPRVRAGTVVVPYPDLEDITSMSKEQFDAFFCGTALAWRGRTVLQRNAVIAMGNSLDLKYLSSLESALRSPSPVVRGHAAWSLGRMGTPGSRVLTRARAGETDPRVREEIDRALEEK